MLVEVEEVYGSEHTILNAARVSLGNHRKVDKDTPLTDKDRGLLKRLLKDQHGTPFEKAGFIFKIEAPIFVLHQLQRHRWSSFNELSGRYTTFEPVFYLPEVFRKQTGKRMDYIFEEFDEFNNILIKGRFEDVYQEIYKFYQVILSYGVAREHARLVLPTSIYTAAYWSINVRSLCNFLSLRMDEHAQGEIQELSRQIMIHFKEYFPYLAELFQEIAFIAPERDINT